MHIHDFHARLVSPDQDNSLFAALRKLSAIEDPRSLVSEDLAGFGGWTTWVQAPASAPSLAPEPA